MKNKILIILLSLLIIIFIANKRLVIVRPIKIVIEDSLTSKVIPHILVYRIYRSIESDILTGHMKSIHRPYIEKIYSNEKGEINFTKKVFLLWHFNEYVEEFLTINLKADMDKINKITFYKKKKNDEKDLFFEYFENDFISNECGLMKRDSIEYSSVIVMSNWWKMEPSLKSSMIKAHRCEYDLIVNDAGLMKSQDTITIKLNK